MKYDWKITLSNRRIAEGSIEAESQREAMGRVLVDNAEGKDPDKSYTITVGDGTMSSYGDEFIQSAEVTGWTEERMEEDGHLFAAPKGWANPMSDPLFDIQEAAADIRNNPMDEFLEIAKREGWHVDLDKVREFHDLMESSTPGHGCHIANDGIHDMTGEAQHPKTGERHAQCRYCGVIDAQSLGIIRGTDRVYGYATHGAQKGAVVHVRLAFSTPPEACLAGDYIVSHEAVRMGAGGRVYPMPATLRKMVFPAPVMKSGVYTTLEIDCGACGERVPVDLPGSGPWSGVPCPSCGATYSFEKSF